MNDENSIFIGTKPFMNYVTGVVMQCTTKSANEVTIKARGKFITKAVDVAEASTKRFLQNNISINDIRVNSEEFTSKEGKNIRVSTIELVLGRK